MASSSTRSQSQIQSDLAAIRSRLTGSVEALIDEVHPQRVKQRQIDHAKSFARGELENAKAQIFTARGDLRTERVAAAGGIVAGLIAVLVLIRTAVRRRKQS